MYYPCSENKGADQLRGHREADLRLCFRLCKLLVFSCTGSLFFCRSEFEGITPDYQALEESDKSGRILEVIFTMKGSDQFKDKHGKAYDFVSRNFSPWVGIPEDPVTGKLRINRRFLFRFKSLLNIFHSKLWDAMTWLYYTTTYLNNQGIEVVRHYPVSL